MLQIADYWSYPNRFDFVNLWWSFHGMPGDFTEATLPKLAIFVLKDDVPVCFLACDMSNSIGKATLESALTAPGLTASDARESLRFASSALISRLKQLDYGLVQTFSLPAIARTLEREGWTRGPEFVQLTKLI